jgi:hypothetical protein
VALFKNAYAHIWSIDDVNGKHQHDTPTLKFKFPAKCNLTMVQASPDTIVGAGHSSSYIVVKSLASGKTFTDNDRIYRLPDGATGVDQISLLSDPLLLAFISGGTFYLVDLG